MYINRGMDTDVVHICNEIRVSHKKNGLMPFAAIWVDLGIVTGSEVSQRKTNTIPIT